MTDPNIKLNVGAYFLAYYRGKFFIGNTDGELMEISKESLEKFLKDYFSENF